jgi:hypothetical protein
MMRLAVLALLASAACAGGAAPNQQPPLTATSDTARTSNQSDLVPPRHGTLRQEEVTLSIRSGPLLVKVTPLDETVIRLLAPDTYDRLHALAQAQRPARVSTHRALFLVSFFSYEPNITFTPEDLQIVHQGRILRAAAVQPVTSRFGRQQLQQQETQSAVYAFEEAFNYDLSIIVRYRLDEAGDWLAIQQRLERERSRVRARTRGEK